MVIYKLRMAETWKQSLETTLKSSMVVLAGVAITNLLNYTFTVFIGRALQPKEYGTITTLLTLSLIVSPMIAAISNLFAKFTTEYHATNQYNKIINIFHRALQSGVALGFLSIAVIWATSGITSRLLHIPRSYILLFAMVIGCNFPRSINLGIIQGLQRFRIYTFIIVSEIIIKLCIVAFYAQRGLTVSKTIAAILFSTVVISLFTTAALNKRISAKTIKLDSTSETAKNARLSWTVQAKMLLFISLGTTLLLDTDMLFVQHYIDAEQAGKYAALMIVSRIIYYASLPFGIVLFPAMINARSKKPGNEQALFEHGLIIIMMIAGILAMGLIAFPEYALNIFFGSTYASVAGYLHLTAITALGWVAITTLSAYFITIEKYAFCIIILSTAAAQLVGIFLFHDSLMQIITVVMGSSVLTAIGMASMYLFQRNNTATA